MTSVISHVESTPESPRNIWGPLLWNSFHLLCTISDRRDIIFRWRKLLELTSVILPCAICRKHMSDYLHTHRMFGKQLKKWIPKNGDEVKIGISNGMHIFHNHVNSSNGKPVLSFEEAQKVLNIEGKTRKEIGSMIIENLSKLEPYMNSYKPRDYAIWYSDFITLIRLCESGAF
jgi:hypothetical protein